MADDTQGTSPKNEPAQIDVKEDAETRAARRELKQSSISDPTSDGEANRSPTPTQNADSQGEDLKDQVASPKKKRAHDQLDSEKQTDDNDANSVASSDSAKDRALRTEPEKKRHRDDEKVTELEPAADSVSKSPTKDKTQPQTSTSAFAASGFGKLSASSSPFASLGGSQEKSGFAAAGAPSLTSFASPSTSAPKAAGATAVPKLSFSGNSSASPFAGVATSSNGFGSPFGASPFGSALGGLGGVKPLSSFAAPGGGSSLNSDKPAKPFGAPDSDAEGDDENDDGEEDAQTQDAERALSPEKETKVKLQKVEVNDGEGGEATLISVRAKMFYHDKEAGWKERGAGMLKINAPQACIEYDDNGSVIPGSFDASGLELDEEAAGEGTKGHRVVRLIMRQDQTHRVILNTVIVPAMKFEEKASLKSVGIVFTAFEGEQAQPVSVTMRMTAANAKIFMNEISVIQKELQSS